MSETKTNEKSELDWLEDLKDLNKDLEERILEANKESGTSCCPIL